MDGMCGNEVHGSRRDPGIEDIASATSQVPDAQRTVISMINESNCHLIDLVSRSATTIPRLGGCRLT